jgi:hypothetical protein
MLLNQAIPASFEWPTRLRIFDMYQLWHFGDLDRHYGPYKYIESKDLTSKPPEISHAKYVCTAIDKRLPCGVNMFTGLSRGERDVQYKQAVAQLAADVKAAGHQKSLDSIVSKLAKNFYTTVYVADLSVLRK